MRTKSKAKEFDYKTIKTFNDACEKLGIDPNTIPVVEAILTDLQKPVIALYRLMVIFKAINNGWEPDWSNSNQYKYYPWFYVLSSGFGFSDSYYFCASTYVGSRLCTDTSEKALYIAKQFEKDYEDFLLIKP
jgi:hypothetical protein